MDYFFCSLLISGRAYQSVAAETQLIINAPHPFCLSSRLAASLIFGCAFCKHCFPHLENILYVSYSKYYVKWKYSTQLRNVQAKAQPYEKKKLSKLSLSIALLCACVSVENCVCMGWELLGWESNCDCVTVDQVYSVYITVSFWAYSNKPLSNRFVMQPFRNSRLCGNTPATP